MNASIELRIDRLLMVGQNARGFEFSIGLLNHRWVAFVRRRMVYGTEIHIFRARYESYTPSGSDLIRARVIGMVAAIAQDPARGFGGVDEWYVEEELRATPEQYRCPHCGKVACLECEP